MVYVKTFGAKSGYWRALIETKKKKIDMNGHGTAWKVCPCEPPRNTSMKIWQWTVYWHLLKTVIHELWMDVLNDGLFMGMEMTNWPWKGHMNVARVMWTFRRIMWRFPLIRTDICVKCWDKSSSVRDYVDSIICDGVASSDDLTFRSWPVRCANTTRRSL